MGRLIDADVLKEDLTRFYDGEVTARQLIDEQPTVQPDHTADIGKKVSISCGQENDLISRKAAIEALARMMPRSYTPDGSHPGDEEIFRAQEVFADCIEALEIQPSAQPETATVTIGRTKGSVTMWYECDACGEPIDQKDCYCRNCGRKLTLPEPYKGGDSE